MGWVSYICASKRVCKHQRRRRSHFTKIMQNKTVVFCLLRLYFYLISLLWREKRWGAKNILYCSTSFCFSNKIILNISLIFFFIKALPKFLQCVDWASLEQVTETHKLLRLWSPITMEVSSDAVFLQLLTLRH